MKQADAPVERLDLNLLIVFDALLRDQSVTRAGKTLGLTQSAVSHALTRLRAYFDDPLFVKSGRGIVPTAKCEGLSAVVLDVMGTIRDRVLSEASFDPLRARRTFNFCMSDMGELVFLPTLMSMLKERAPHCRINTMQVLPDRLPAVLASGEGDLAMGTAVNASEGLFQQDLFSHTFVCIVSVKNKAVGRTLTTEAYGAMPHIAVTLTGQPHKPYDRAVEDAGIRRDLRILTPHFLVIPLLLDQHPEYIATVPRALGAAFADHGVVRMVEPPVPLPSFMLRQYWHPRFHHDPANRWLRTMMKKAFDQMPVPKGRR